MKNTIKAKAIAILEKEGKVKLINVFDERKVVYNRKSLNDMFKFCEMLDEPVVDAVKC